MQFCNSKALQSLDKKIPAKLSEMYMHILIPIRKLKICNPQKVLMIIRLFDYLPTFKNLLLFKSI